MTDKKFVIIENRQLSGDIFKMTIKSDSLPEIKAGQFLNFELPQRKDLIIRRPFGINGFDSERGTVDILYRVRGKGTEYMTTLKAGEEVNVFLPLGNGFTISPEQKKVVIVGGGMGVAPLLPLPLTYPSHEFYTFLGFKNHSDVVEVESFKRFSKETFVSIDSEGRGFVTDLLKREISRIAPDIILSCGPEALFKSLKDIDTGDTPIYVSLEERMACGIGACLVCACGIKAEGGAMGQAETHKKRCCKDGPVFSLREVVL